MFKPALASLLLVGALPAAGQSFIDDFSSATVNAAFNVGSGLGQVSTGSVGTSSGGVSAIDGTSMFLTINTSSVDRTAGGGGYGGGIRVNLNDAFEAGELTSTDAADYTIDLELAANGFEPQFVDVFIRFAGGEQFSVNQGNATVASAITTLAAGNASVPVSIGLSDFGLTAADLAILPTAGSLQLQVFTRSNNAEAPNDPYSAGAGNVLVLDNAGVTLVPEPASAALLASGALCLLARRRRTA